MSHPLDVSDGVETYRYTQEGTQLTRSHTSNLEDAILNDNAALRANGGSRRMDWGRLSLRMSLAQYRLLVKINPALVSRDRREQQRAWLKLLNDGDYSKLKVT